MRQMQVQPLGWEDLLEEEMATHSSIPAGEIPWTEEPGGVMVHRVMQHLHAGETHNVNTLLFPCICPYTLSMNTHLCTPSHMHVIPTITTHSQMHRPTCAHPLPPTVPQTPSHTCTHTGTHTLTHSCSGTDTLACPPCSGSPCTAGPLGTR